jgi:hypothetical protein
MEADHALGKDEALKRLKDKFTMVRDTYSSHVSELKEVWDDNVLSFGFKVMGMKTSGTVTVEDSQVLVDADLPFAAIMFRGAIEKEVRAELGTLLA